MRRFYAPPERFDSNVAVLDEDETRHLRDVLRLKKGEAISVFDGNGHEFGCIISEIEKKQTILNLQGEIVPAAPESPVLISLAATVLNGEKYDLIVQKAVELGAIRLIPIHTIRCDVKVKDAAKRLSRWRRIAMEATKQTGRAKLMEIAEPIEVSDLINNTPVTEMIMFSERDGIGIESLSPGKKITAIFGPKGGWDDDELKLAKEVGVAVVTLGGRILRAETAAIALTAILQNRFGDLN